MQDAETDVVIAGCAQGSSAAEDGVPVLRASPAPHLVLCIARSTSSTPARVFLEALTCREGIWLRMERRIDNRGC
jgi:hypothetical protein